MNMQHDILIVGAGTAGCVLAGRLSAASHRSVLLVEAGPDMKPGCEPATIRDPYPSSYGDPSFAWPGLVAEVGADLGDGRRAVRRFIQGRGVGGSSNLMGMMASRGSPADYDEWRDLGAAGWGWNDVLPFFRRLETDLDFAGTMHGRDGPIPIRRHCRDRWPPFCSAVADAMERQGYDYFPDYNGEFRDGVSTIPMNNLPDRRVTTAMAYLDDTVRRRPNLRILCDATVERILFDGRRAIGVELRTSGGREVHFARETIVAAGALHSPALLLRSGLGAAASLAQLGIAPVVDLPGVGDNLCNHVVVQLAVHLPRRARQTAAIRAWPFAILRYSSGHVGCPAGDMHIFPNNKASWHPLGRQIGALGMGVRKPFSRGRVTLPRADAAPRVQFDILSDPRDFDRLVDAVALGCALLADARVRTCRDEVFVPDAAQAARLNRPALGSWLRSRAIASLFDLSPGLRRKLLGKRIFEPADIEGDALRALVRQLAAPVHHVCGTCRMGAADDAGAVVDPQLRVRGVAGLRVADASIMPTIVSGNTHLPVVMIAEKAADQLRAA
jgi:5-(hydroxymethyl)furfural/furfural oxidase